MNRIASGVATAVLLFASVALYAQGNKTADNEEGNAEYAYVLTVDNFKKLEKVVKAVGEWADNNQQTSSRILKDNSFVKGTPAERARIVDIKYPDLAGIIRKHGLSTQEYFLGRQVESHALLLLEAMSQGETKDYAKNVNPANLTFVKQHRAEINIRIKM